MEEKSDNNHIYIIIAIIVITVGVIFWCKWGEWCRDDNRKWSCVEGTCEKIIDGDYDSLQDCQLSCPLKKKKETYLDLERVADMKKRKKVWFEDQGKDKLPKVHIKPYTPPLGGL